MLKKVKKTSWENVFVYIILILGSVIMIFPFLWMILTSLKTLQETMQIPPTFLPNKLFNFNAYEVVMKSLPFTRLYVNTGLMILVRVICATAFSSIAAYAFAKMEFPGKNILFMIIITQLMLPAQVFIIPQFTMVAAMNMTNTIFGLVFPGVVSAFGTFFLRQSYMSIPNDIIEAAIIDGCNHFKIFFKIAFPLTKSVVAALAIFTALFAYSDLMWPLVVNTDLNMLTLSSGLSTLKGQYMTNYPNLMAGSVLAMWPMIVLYLFCQKQFIEGIALTGTKA